MNGAPIDVQYLPFDDVVCVVSAAGDVIQYNIVSKQVFAFVYFPTSPFE